MYNDEAFGNALVCVEQQSSTFMLTCIKFMCSYIYVYPPTVNRYIHVLFMFSERSGFFSIQRFAITGNLWCNVIEELTTLKVMATVKFKAPFGELVSGTFSIIFIIWITVNSLLDEPLLKYETVHSSRNKIKIRFRILTCEKMPRLSFF